MTISYSPSTRGFYDTEIHSTIPADARVITALQHRRLLEQQTAGKVIAPDGAGDPVAADRPAPTADEIKRVLTAAVQRHLDVRAQELGYDNIFTAVTYADEPVIQQFQAEGKALRAWRSQVWAACYAVMADVELGQRAVPSADELISELPTLGLPL